MVYLKYLVIVANILCQVKASYLRLGLFKGTTVLEKIILLKAIS